MKNLLIRTVLFFSVGLLSFSIWLPKFYRFPYPYSLAERGRFRPGMNKKHAQTIAQNQPRVILLGDSVLYSGVDDDVLSRQLGVSVYNMGVSGMASAAWYLMMKNIIVEAPVTPEYVVILFRSTLLTNPTFRTTGTYFVGLDDFAAGREPLFTKIAILDPMPWAEKLAEQYLPLYAARWKIRDDIDSTTRYALAEQFLNCDPKCATRAIDQTFGGKALGAVIIQQAVYDGDALNAPQNLNFKQSLEKSFLPVILQLAQEHKIKLIFVQMKNMSMPQKNSEPPALRAYLADLQTYLAAQENAAYIDLSHDERLLDAYFIDMVHLNENGRAALTQIFAEELAPFVLK